MRSALLPIIPCAALLAGCSSMNDMAPMAADAVAYEITWTPTWTAQSHPLDYPEAGLLSGPHFSGIIGASHGGGYALFTTGQAPSPGLERLSEEGKHSPLDSEIRAAIADGRAGSLFETGPITDLGEPMTGTVFVTPRHSRVSAAAMIAPSRDWFAGAADVELREGGQWVAEKEVLVWACDSGGDAGTTYAAADMDLQPKQPTMLNDSPHFRMGERRVPVATLTFRRK